LIQSIFVRVPVTEMRFPMSKIAEGEWCADSIAAKSNKTVHVATETLPLKMASLVRNGSQYSTRVLSPEGR
jgi:hypothetical protein